MNSKKILFVCVENAGRSQMAEAFFREHGPDGFEPHSCGTTPGRVLNLIVVSAMQEVGIDITNQRPKLLTSEDLSSAVEIVNMGCMDSSNCPAALSDKTLDWQISDPKYKSIEEVRKIRDEIESKIKNLAKYLRHNY